MGAGREQIDRAGPPNPRRLRCILSRGWWRKRRRGGRGGRVRLVCGCRPDATAAINKEAEYAIQHPPETPRQQGGENRRAAAAVKKSQIKRLSIRYSRGRGYSNSGPRVGSGPLNHRREVVQGNRLIEKQYRLLIKHIRPPCVNFHQ